MVNHRQDSMLGKPAAPPPRTQRANGSPVRQGMTLPRLPDLQSTITSGSSWTEGSSFASPHDLPPHYDLHQFPPTPPALQSPSPESGSYFDQSHHTPPLLTVPSANPAHAPAEPPPRAFTSRFPRWGSWLEKRALERHYAQLDRQTLEQHVQLDRNNATPSRKKSWGAWVNDPDAINDDHHLLDGSSQQQARVPDAASLPPLHLHHFGSRFIPHVPAQPLCSILVELPSDDENHLARPSGPNPTASRQVLLIGTAQGLYAVQIRQDRSSSSQPRAPNSASASPPLPTRQWNENIRCIPIWTGLAVYQMCVLASNEGSASAKANSLPSNKMATSGVFLALTCPSSARDGFLTSSLMQLSAHAGSILESVAATGISSSSSSSSHNSHGVSDTGEGVASANFGATAGGGSGRAVPPGGTGVVRMWHLQAIRELLIYALDRSDAQLPIDLAASAGQADKRVGLGSIFKKTFSKPKSKSETKAASSNRSISKGSLTATISPLPKYGETGAASPNSISAPLQRSKLDGELDTGDGSSSRHESGQTSSAPQRSPPSARRHVDPAHAAAVSLANSSVPIQPSSHSTAGSHGQNASLSSLFAEDLISTLTGNRQASNKGKEREASSQASSKGVLFFSVHEAGADTKGAGTWYLAITYARSVMVYEASVPKHGSTRAWSFLKELYAPFPIKAVAFAPAAVSDTTHPFTALDSLSANAGSTKLRVATADGPLSTSKKNRQSDQGYSTGMSRENSITGPVHVRRGSAAPASWHKADLCLLLSFGRRAVLVRLRDSHVREMDLKPLGQLLPSSNPSTQASPHPRTGLTDAQSKPERVRPLSLAVDGGQKIDGQPMPTAAGHNRAASLEQKFKEAILEKRSNKHNWVGFSSIEAQVLVRQWTVQTSEGEEALQQSGQLARGNSSLSPIGLSLSRNYHSSAAETSLAGVDKELPRVPAHQNASFDRRFSRLYLSEQSLQDHSVLQAEGSSDSDDNDDADDDGDDPRIDSRDMVPAFQLTDPGPLPRIKNRRPVQGTTPKRSVSLPPAELVSAKLALASRGSVTHIMPLPLPTDLAQTNPLAVMQWSDTPNAVSGWARVLGVERASSKGPTPLSHLKQASTTSTASDPSWFHADAWAAHHTSGYSAAQDARRKCNRLVLHVGITCVAFLASRIEARKVTVKIPVEVEFRLAPDSELELIGVASNREYNRMNGTPDANIDMQSAEQETLTPHEEHHDDATSLGEGSQVPSSRFTFSYPPPAAHVSDDNVPVSRTEAYSLSQELEYLCAPLLTFHPMDLDPRSSGSQSLILSHSQGGKADSTSSAAHSLFADLAGDAGVVAFDWRGADDFRIFTVGIAG